MAQPLQLSKNLNFFLLLLFPPRVFFGDLYVEPSFLISLKSASCVLLELIKNSDHVTLCHQSRHQTPKALGSSLLCCCGWLDIIPKLSESSILYLLCICSNRKKEVFCACFSSVQCNMFEQQYKILKMLSGLDFLTATAASFLFSTPTTEL